MHSQALQTPDEMTEMREQGASAHVYIGNYHISKMLEKRAPAAVIRQNTGV
jgi:hypothetical protein